MVSKKYIKIIYEYKRIAFNEIEYEQSQKRKLKKSDNRAKELLEKSDKNKTVHYKNENNQKTRLREHANNHLKFLTDFRMDFISNLAELYLRIIKAKLKIARHPESTKQYCNTLSI